MKRIALTLLAALPMMAAADESLYVPAVAATLCKEAPVSAALQRAVKELQLPADPTAPDFAQPAGAVEVLHMAPMPDNTFRSAFMDCDKLEVYVAARGGMIDTTRWYGPYKVAELMTARGAAAPRFQ